MAKLKGKFNLGEFMRESSEAMKPFERTGEFGPLPDLKYTVGEGETEESIRGALKQRIECGLDRFNTMNKSVFESVNRGESLTGKTLTIPFWMVYLTKTTFSQPGFRKLLEDQFGARAHLRLQTLSEAVREKAEARLKNAPDDLSHGSATNIADMLEKILIDRELYNVRPEGLARLQMAKEKKKLEIKLKSLEGKRVPEETVKRMVDEFVKIMCTGREALDQATAKLIEEEVAKALAK